MENKIQTNRYPLFIELNDVIDGTIHKVDDYICFITMKDNKIRVGQITGKYREYIAPLAYTEWYAKANDGNTYIVRSQDIIVENTIVNKVRSGPVVEVIDDYFKR